MRYAPRLIGLWRHPGLSGALRLLLAAVFLYASLDKLRDPEGFARAVANYRLLPTPLVALWAVSLPWMEVLAGTLLLLGAWARPSVLLLNLILASFVVAIGQALARGIDISCGCFQVEGGERIGLPALLRTGLLLLAGLQVLLHDQGRFSLAGLWARRRGR